MHKGRKEIEHTMMLMLRMFLFTLISISCKDEMKLQEDRCLGFDLIESQSADLQEHAIVQAMIDRWQMIVDVKVVQETYDHFGFDTSGFSRCVPFLDSLTFIEFDCDAQSSGHWQSSLLDVQMVPGLRYNAFLLKQMDGPCLKVGMEILNICKLLVLASLHRGMLLSCCTWIPGARRSWQS